MKPNEIASLFICLFHCLFVAQKATSLLQKPEIPNA